MSKQKPTTQIIRYWHPRKGGWYFGYVIRKGYKWATIQESNSSRRHRIAASDVREAA